MQARVEQQCANERSLLGRFVVALLVVLVLAAVPGSTLAQEPPTEREVRHSSGLWLGFYTKYRLSDRFDYYGEYHFRRYNQIARDMGQIYLRFGINWRVHPQAQVMAGIVTPLYWSPRDRSPTDAVVVPQFRLWQQALLAQDFARVRVYHQFRTEQRWARAYAQGSPFRLTGRFRYKVQLYVPLERDTLSEPTFFLTLAEEIFMQAGKSIVFNHFEDNRLYFAAGRILNESLQVQLGYMWSFRHDGTPSSYESRHIIRASLMHNLDLRKIRRRR